MDDLLNVDLNMIDDEHLLSFPFENFESIDPPEVENFLNELERGYSESNGSSNDADFIMNDDSIISWLSSGSASMSPAKTPTRSKSRPAAGVSLLAKPPRKPKKRPSTALSLLNSPVKKEKCNSKEGSSDANQTFLEVHLQFDHNYCLPVKQRPLLLPVEGSGRFDEITLGTSPSESVVHDVDAYFNSFFTLDSEPSSVASTGSDSAISTDSGSDDGTEPIESTVTELITLERVEEFELKASPSVNVIQIEKKPLLVSQRCIDLNDLNEYELTKLNDSSESSEIELMDVGEDSSDQDDDDDGHKDDSDEDLLVDETKMFIKHMLSDLSEVKIGKEKSSSSLATHSCNSKRSMLHKSQSSSEILPKSVMKVSPGASGCSSSCSSSSSTNEAGQSSRSRTRTISASYSVRSNSACSCCSDELSDDEPEVLLDSRSQCKIAARTLIRPSKATGVPASAINKSTVVVSSGIRGVPRRLWLGRFETLDQIKIRPVKSSGELTPLRNHSTHLPSRSTMRRSRVRPRSRPLELDLFVS